MAKRTAKARGKHPARTLQGSDGQFLPDLPNPPGSPSRSALEPQSQHDQEVARTPLHPGGLVYPSSSSSDRIYAVNLRLGGDAELVMGHGSASPLHTSLPLVSPLGRSSSAEIPVLLLPYAPVTVESVPDEDDAARHWSHEELVSMEIGSHIQVNQVPGSSEIIANQAPASAHMWDSPPSQALILWGLGPEAHSAGSADVECMLNEPNRSARLSRSVRSRAPSSIEHELREYTEHAEECTQAALDLNCQAMGLLMESLCKYT